MAKSARPRETKRREHDNCTSLRALNELWPSDLVKRIRMMSRRSEGGSLSKCEDMTFFFWCTAPRLRVGRLGEMVDYCE